jgi:lipopolysaccharide/colanic/teichoic acid biosynthesis glycosyltransferase
MNDFQYKLAPICVDSTSANDSRITPIGHKIRKYKLDEITQLWNVLIGDMS